MNNATGLRVDRYSINDQELDQRLCLTQRHVVRLRFVEFMLEHNLQLGLEVHEAALCSIEHDMLLEQSF